MLQYPARGDKTFFPGRPSKSSECDTWLAIGVQESVVPRIDGHVGNACIRRRFAGFKENQVALFQVVLGDTDATFCLTAGCTRQ